MGAKVKNYLNFSLNALATCFLLIMSDVSFAKPVDLNKLRSERTLFTCLRMNYQRISPDVFKNDYSYFHPRYLPLSTRSRPDYDLKFGEFMEKQVGDFYKEEISVKAENSRGPHTVIFAKCIEFSESKVLREFFRKNPLPTKPNKD
jgi:hypothetical protein